jgi:microcompartment protein CcmK/EutM
MKYPKDFTYHFTIEPPHKTIFIVKDRGYYNVGYGVEQYSLFVVGKTARSFATKEARRIANIIGEMVTVKDETR